jgi:hypothetical protein
LSIIPPEEPFAEHEAAPEGPIKRRTDFASGFRPPTSRAYAQGYRGLLEEYKKWKNQIKTTEGGRRLVITQQLLQRLAQNPNTAKTLNEKT